MVEQKPFENYPCRTLALSNLLTLSIYFLGGYILYQFGALWLGLYLLYALALEFRVMKNSCVSCHYYGKTCAFGKGKLAALFFKKGSPGKFAKREISPKDLIPELLASLVPLIAGLGLLIFSFSWAVLASVVLLAVLTSAGNGFVRGKLACRFCRQRELGCPAERMFRKGRKLGRALASR
ncbi:MAG: hypothetical protein JW727_06345 [Candidatus Aenigmarchaeota archaeon]|nr:hypothetical protein [Candidatus Aenigmarchaeota archaeon]